MTLKILYSKTKFKKPVPYTYTCHLNKNKNVDIKFIAHDAFLDGKQQLINNYSTNRLSRWHWPLTKLKPPKLNVYQVIYISNVLAKYINQIVQLVTNSNSFTPICFVGGSWFIYVICFHLKKKYTCVQHVSISYDIVTQ